MRLRAEEPAVFALRVANHVRARSYAKGQSSIGNRSRRSNDALEDVAMLSLYPRRVRLRPSRDIRSQLVTPAVSVATIDCAGTSHDDVGCEMRVPVFLGTRNAELVCGRVNANRLAAAEASGDYIENFYSLRRRHFQLRSIRAPSNFELRSQTAALPACSE